ncbi:formate/nitrite transporter family protein [Bacillus sp. FJAT-47783]|uniref:formate/nitrite transporter family protein n=1 Tax=Bacillus sp. FJAT-47783 TaxID=2922712 RepID=UPI001FAD456D|nr:formate/nitrite transporter family protein [Bacillus sp. FJAT-47783]
MAHSEIEALESLCKKAEDSVYLITVRPLEYFFRAVLAGAFIGFALIFTLKSINTMFLQNSPFTSLIGGLIFGVALVLIVYGGAELFTGNTMYFTSSTLRRFTSLSETVKVLILCYVGNAVGAFLFALFIIPTGIIQELGMNQWLFSIVESKMHHTSSEIFVRAIFCNWMVCLAIFIPKQMKQDIAKIFSMMLLVCAFFVSGFEHCIANFSLFSFALLVPHPETITVGGAFHNITFATFGNIVGGAIFMGFLYTWLNKNHLQSKPFVEKRKSA